MLSYALKNSEVQSVIVVDTESVSIGTIVLYIILIIGFLFLIFGMQVCKSRNHPPKNCSTDDFILKEGEITQSRQYRDGVLSINAASQKCVVSMSVVNKVFSSRIFFSNKVSLKSTTEGNDRFLFYN